MIKLVVSDIDGTLLEDGGRNLNPEYYDVILKLREKGMQFAAASGRQWISIERIFNPIKEKIFYLSDNGAYVGCHGRQLYAYTIERELARQLAREIRSTPGLTALMSGPDVEYLEEDADPAFYDWLVNGYQFRIQRVKDLMEVKDSFIKVSAYRSSDIESPTRPLREKYGDRLKMAVAGDMWLDCMAPGINKGQAVKLIQESLGIAPEETMVFGDQLNDIEMLKQGYYSFAVGNARPEVKAAARFQADTNQRDGVLKILKCLL